MTNQRVETVSVLWRIARPTHLLLIVFVHLLGATMAMALGDAFEGQLLLFGLFVLLIESSSVHIVNEYADYETDALTKRTPFSGGSGALPNSTVSRRVALRAGWAVAALFFLMFPLFVGWSLPPRVAWSSYLVAPLVVLGGLLHTKERTPFAPVAAMITMAVVQFAAWFSLLAI